MFLAYFTFGMMGVLGALTPDIIKDYHLSRFSAGLFGSALFLAVALFAIPSGLLADRLGARRVILAGVSLMALDALWYPDHTATCWFSPWSLRLESG